MSILIEQPTLSDRASLIACINNTFPSGEVMTEFLEVTADEYFSYAALVATKAIADGLSFIAKDVQTNEILGFCINEDLLTAPNFEEVDISPKLGPIFALLDQLDKNYLGEINPKQGDLFHSFMIGVEKKAQGQNVAKRLIRASENLAKEYGYKKIVVEATGSASQRLFQQFDFKVFTSIPYSEFEFQGSSPFRKISVPRSCVLLEKDLASA